LVNNESDIVQYFFVEQRKEKMKRKLETTTTKNDETNSSKRLRPELPGSIMAEIAEFLDPPTRVKILDFSRSVFKNLSAYYCSKHGCALSSEGLCLDDIKKQIRRDGLSVKVFKKKLAQRTAKVNPNKWYKGKVETAPFTLPLDFDPVYQKYFLSLKSCAECEEAASHTAMAKLGLVPCLPCKKYMEPNEVVNRCPTCRSCFCQFCWDYKMCYCCSRDYSNGRDYCHRCRPLTSECMLCRTKACDLHPLNFRKCDQCERVCCDDCRRETFTLCFNCDNPTLEDTSDDTDWGSDDDDEEDDTDSGSEDYVEDHINLGSDSGEEDHINSGLNDVEEHHIDSRSDDDEEDHTDSGSDDDDEDASERLPNNGG